MQSLHRRIIGLFLLSLVLVSVLAAPLKDDRGEKENALETDKEESPVTSQHQDKEETAATETREETLEAADPEVNEDVPEEDDESRGQEVINYQDIQVDHNSRVTSENKNQEIDSKDDDEEEEEEDDLEDDVDAMPSYVLSPVEARELMLELRDPVEVAKFVVETDDAEGFLRALRLLLNDGYITPEQAYSLKDEVALQLRNLLMLQQVELSRALFDTYEPPVEENPNLDLENLLYPETQPVDFYEYGNMINQDAPYDGPLAENFYEAYQEQIEQESQEAIAEIAELLAQRIAKGEISPEEGAKIMNKVIQLLPESYWGQSEEEMSSESMTSEYPVNVEDSVDLSSSQGEDLLGYMGEKEDEPAVEDFEEELLERGPGKMETVIEEEDENGDDDAEELEEEAKNLAEELEDELRKGGQSSEEKTMKIERPGAKAIVKVGPSNDVTNGQDLKEDWKEMSLLLDHNIPEDVLRSVGISLEKEAKEMEEEEAKDEEQVEEEEETANN